MAVSPMVRQATLYGVWKQRRIVLKATASIASGLMAVVLCFSAGRAMAGPVSSGVVALVSAAGLAQTDATTSQPDNKRQQAADLLQRARQAMKEGDLTTADLLVSQADSLKVEYSPITMEDTPRKARQALEQIRSVNAGSAGPSPWGSDKRAAPPSDPFYGRTPAATDVTVTPLPPAGVAQPLPLVGQRTQSDTLLRMSRCALATGDVRRAVDLLNRAKQLQVRYGPLDDSPERVEAAIGKYQEVITLDRNSEAGRRNYARMLMEQAEALVHYGEFDLAEQLADRAVRQGVTYGPYERKPQELMAQIGADRRRSATLIRPLPPPADVRPPCATGNPEGLAVVGEEPSQGVVSPVVYNPSQDPTRNVQASSVQAASPVVGQQLGYSEPVPASVAAASPPPPPSLSLLSPPPPPESSPTTPPPPDGYSTTPPPPESSPATPAIAPPATPAIAPPAAAGAPGTSPGYALFQQGEAALRAHDRDRAYQSFRQAVAYLNELDAATGQRLLDHLQLLSAPNSRPAQAAVGARASARRSPSNRRWRGSWPRNWSGRNRRPARCWKKTPEGRWPSWSKSAGRSRRPVWRRNTAMPCCGTAIAAWPTFSNSSPRTARGWN